MNKEAPFLQSLAQQCKATFGQQCDRLTVIFPNKRAGTYFAEYLAQQYDQPIWAPQIMSFEEYVENQQTKNFADDLQMIFLLYKAYGQIVKNPESFDAFFPWGEMILKDYNDIDNYLVEVDHIFRVIKSQKELDEAFRYLSEKDQQTIQSFWKGFLPKPNKKQTEFIATWSILAELYEKFNHILSENDLTYKGRMFRAFTEEITPLPDGDTIWFAGFNALTKAEEKIIKSYLDLDCADIFWDIDNYYFADKNQESGTFFRAYAQDKYFRSSISRDIKNSIEEAEIEMPLLSAPFSMGQIKGVAQQVQSLNLSREEQSQLLIILTDESLLQSLLQALPSEIEDVNVTMGWPLFHSRIFLFLSRVIHIKEQYLTSQTPKIPQKEVLAMLEFNDLLGIGKERIAAFETSTIAQNRVYLDPEWLKSEFEELSPLLNFEGSVRSWTNTLINFLAAMDSKKMTEADQAASVLLHGTLKRLITATDQYGVDLNFESFNKLFSKLGHTLKLPLSGDTKRGVQIMGILETRNLSFKHVLIVGMNEGQWPKDSSNTSFIPYNIRKAFDLPTVEHQDAMQSYLFYRLLHSAEHLWASYNNISEFNHNGEPSRYLRQLQYESKLSIREFTLINPIAAEGESSISIKKNEDTLKDLYEFTVTNEKSGKRLSPSALNTYIDCRLKFYFQHIARIKEPDELLEDMDPSLFGNLLHGAMEQLYAEKETWQQNDVAAAYPRLDEAVRRSFEEQKLTLDTEQTGRQLIAYEVIKAYMKRILAFDENHTPFRILGLEATDYVVDYPIDTEKGELKIGLKGIIDRIDQYGESIRVLDYKSGRDERQFGAMIDLIDGHSNKRNKAVFQLFYYCLLYRENHQELTSPILPGLFNSKDLFMSNFDTLLTQTIDRKKRQVLNYADFEGEFKEILTQLLAEIFNPDVPFDQTADEKKCVYCTYRQICKRG